MKRNQNNQQFWYFAAGIVIIAANTWGLAQPIQGGYVVGLCVLIIGLFGGIEPLFKMLYDLGQRPFQIFPLFERKLLIIIVGVLFPIVGGLQSKLVDLRSDIKRRDRVNELIDECVDAASAIGMSVPQLTNDNREAIQTIFLEDDTIELTKHRVYREAINQLYDEPPDHLETRLVVLYTYEIDQAKENHQKSRLQREIDSLLASATFHPLNEDGRRILSMFVALRKQGRVESKGGTLFSNDIEITESDIEHFVRRYTRTQLSTYLMRSKEQAEEFRNTLADLVRHGRLQLQNLTEDVIQENLEDAKRQLEEHDDRYKSYVVMSTKLMNRTDPFGAVEAMVDKFPQTIYVPAKRAMGDGFPDLKFVSMWLVYTGQAYESAEDFIGQELKPLLPAKGSEEWPDGGFVAAIPFEAPAADFYPSEEEVLAEEDEAKRDARRDNIDAVRMLTVAREAAAVSIVTDDVQREEDIETLLRVIPFNVVAPDLDPTVKNFIKYHYDEIKPHFPEVDTLFHWPEVDKSKLADLLRELDTSDDGERVSDDWDSIVETIMDEIETLANASHISLYST